MTVIQIETIEVNSILSCSISDDNDHGDVYEDLWEGIATTSSIYGAQGLFLVAFFEFMRRSHKMVYAPRLKLTTTRAPAKLPRGSLGWAYAVYFVGDDEILRIAGMDTYVLLRFLRTNLIISLSCLFWSLLVLVPIYLTSNYELESSSTFGEMTMDHVENGTWRLWVSFLSSCLQTILVLHLVEKDWKTHIRRRRDFFKGDGDPDIPGGQQFEYTVTVDHLPKPLRSDSALKQRFEEKLFPGAHGKVFSSIVHLEGMEILREIIAKSEDTHIRLERAIHRSEMKKKAAEKRGLLYRDPTLTFCCTLCRQCRGRLVDHSSVVASSNILCCCKTVREVDHWHWVLEQQNMEAIATKELILRGSREKEHAFLLQKRRRRSIVERARCLPALHVFSRDGNAKSKCAFVTFQISRQTALDASSGLLSNDPLDMEVQQASDPRDVIWGNVMVDIKSVKRRIYIVSIFVRIFAIFCLIPMLVWANETMKTKMTQTGN